MPPERLTRRSVVRLVRRYAWLIGLLVSAVALAASTHSTRAVAATPCGPQLYGVHMDLIFTGRASVRKAAIDAARRVLNARVSRNSLRWDHVQPVEGRWDWSRMDSIVNELVEAGVQPLLVISGSPSWANGVSPRVSRSAFYVPAPGPSFDRWLRAYVSFAGAAARRYKTKVTRWEIWNEPNLAAFWLPHPNLGEYIRVFLNARRAILRANPSAQVAIGGLSNLTLPGASDIRGLDFLSAMIAHGTHPAYVAIHPYTTGGHPPDVTVSGENNFTDIGRVVALLRRKGENARIWVTEWGWSSRAAGERNQARYVATSLELLHRRYRFVKVATIFIDRDRPPVFYEGLLDASFRPKPAAKAFASAVVAACTGRGRGG
jgi:hypothetical protein